MYWKKIIYIVEFIIIGGNMSIRNLIAENAIDDMKKEIKKASGNEVFFRGIPSDDGIIVEVEVIARGN